MLENRITIESRPILEEYLGGFLYGTSGLSFSSLYMWRNINDFSWQIIGDYLCIAGLSHLELETEEPFLFPPLTKTGQYDPESLHRTIEEAKKIFEAKGYIFSIRLMPVHLIDIIESAFPGQLQYFDDRPNYDYLYRTRDLIDLKGRDYHSKKNHLNYFLNHYKYEYIPLTSAMAEDAMQFIREFNLRKNLPEHEMKLLKMEERAMSDVFHNIEILGYHAGAIIIDGKIEALSIGGRLNDNTITVHVEKANTQYRGLYQAINNEFCKHVASTVEFINREEDMGIPGLRKAKLSYKPVKLVESHIAIFKADLKDGGIN
ncbi:DUF2156 domain-containing protein [Sinanaerobacter chloroacetimidivorans]|nr:phosphatidylglycerol lysyltransferase domain-containing protein [Sinanaerobacter chloroacetimidivorans]